MLLSPDQYLTEYLSASSPHPDSLRVSALVLLARARCAGANGDRVRAMARNYSAFANHLRRTGDPDRCKSRYFNRLHIPSGGPMHLEKLEVAGYPARTFATPTNGPGTQIRTFDVFDPAKFHLRRPVARLSLIEHVPGILWEPLDILVYPTYRRKGLATALYAAAEKRNSCPLYSPSGWLTADALAFWSARKPGIAEHFKKLPEFGGLYASAKQTMFLKNVLEWRLLQAAEPPPDSTLQ